MRIHQTTREDARGVVRCRIVDNINLQIVQGIPYNRCKTKVEIVRKKRIDFVDMNINRKIAAICAGVCGILLIVILREVGKREVSWEEDPRRVILSRTVLLDIRWTRRTINRFKYDQTFYKREDARRSSFAFKMLRDAEILLEEGEYTAAVETLEAALSSYPNVHIYYNYGFALSGISAYSDAATAWEISIELGLLDWYGSVKEYYTHFRIACLYSLASNEQKAFEYVKKCTDHVIYILYADTWSERIRDEPDLEYLRSQPDWEKRVFSPTPEETR